MIKDFYVFGYVSREDYCYFFRMFNFENIVLVYGEFRMFIYYVEFVEEEGYLIGRDVFVLRNGYMVEIE